MPVCGYEFHLLVFNSHLTRSLRQLVRYRVEHSQIKFISTRGHVISIHLSEQLISTVIIHQIFRSRAIGLKALRD